MGIFRHKAHTHTVHYTLSTVSLSFENQLTPELDTVQL